MGRNSTCIDALECFVYTVHCNLFPGAYAIIHVMSVLALREVVQYPTQYAMTDARLKSSVLHEFKLRWRGPWYPSAYSRPSLPPEQLLIPMYSSRCLSSPLHLQPVHIAGEIFRDLYSCIVLCQSAACGMLAVEQQRPLIVCELLLTLLVRRRYLSCLEKSCPLCWDPHSISGDQGPQMLRER